MKADELPYASTPDLISELVSRCENAYVYAECADTDGEPVILSTRRGDLRVVEHTLRIEAGKIRKEIEQR